MIKGDRFYNVSCFFYYIYSSQDIKKGLILKKENDVSNGRILRLILSDCGVKCQGE